MLLDRLLLNSYIPPQGQANLKEKVSALGPEGAKEIINRWKLFNLGESLASHMEQLDPKLFQMQITVWAEGKGEEYIVSVLAYACKDELKQVVEDDILIHNCNFIQSAELVCLQFLCTVLVSFPSYCLILMRSFTGYYGYPEHDLPAPRVPVSIEGCREVKALRSIGRF